jgi:hypothetical protein
MPQPTFPLRSPQADSVAVVYRRRRLGCQTTIVAQKMLIAKKDPLIKYFPTSKPTAPQSAMMIPSSKDAILNSAEPIRGERSRILAAR